MDQTVYIYIHSVLHLLVGLFDFMTAVCLCCEYVPDPCNMRSFQPGEIK